tara:strand:- start:929 stop:1249 length:321 start_codon:yes stop_codon:yes gene_type:complete
MPNYNIRYRKNKVQSRFIKTIKFDIGFEEKEEYETEEEVEELEEPSEDMVLYNKLLKDISKIRKNSKRKLECWIRINKEDINGLEDELKTDLLLYIEEKYYRNKND